MKCHACDRTEDDATLAKCPVCHQRFCDDHGAVFSGSRFCSRRCGEFFFFDDPEEGDD